MAKHEVDLLTILLVDDDNMILLSLEEMLKREGYTILTALNGQEALAILKKQPLALIICDQRMPNMTGIEVLKQAQIIQPDTERIIFTGYSDIETILQAINIGQVSQFILKPWEEASLKQTIANSVKKFKLQSENKNLHELILSQHEALVSNHASLRYELNIGARIHETLLEGKVPEHVSGFDIVATTIPSHEIDGDFFEFYHPTPQVLDLLMGDVMGKGIPAALVGTAVKTRVMRFALPFTPSQVFNKNGYWQEDLLAPDAILANIQQELAAPLIHLDFFVSLFYGRFDLPKRTFSYVDCGSTKPLHYQTHKKKVRPIFGEGLPLGTIENQIFELKSVSYNLHDLFIFFSDGVTDTKNPEGELYGLEALTLLIEKNAHQTPACLTDLIKSSLKNFTKKNNFDDDLTLIIIRINDLDSPQIDQEQNAQFIADFSQLQALRDYIDRVCQKAPGNNELLSSQLQLAINEAFCNIVNHSYKGKFNGIVHINHKFSLDGVTFELSDQGETFNPKKIKEPSLAGNEDNGFGLFLIREICDRVAYTPKNQLQGWNHLQLYKKFVQEENYMQITHTNLDQVMIIILESESLDAKIAPKFKEEAINLITSQASPSILFDMHHLKFVDSSGLGALLSILRVVHTQQRELKLAQMTKPVRTLFELVSMHKIFEIYNTLEEAVISFK